MALRRCVALWREEYYIELPVLYLRSIIGVPRDSVRSGVILSQFWLLVVALKLA